MTQPAQQPPAGPPPQSTQQGGQQPPPDAPPAAPATNPQQGQPYQGVQPWQQPPASNPYGQQPQTPPWQPPPYPPQGWLPPPAPGQQQPYPQPYSQPAPAPGGQPSTPEQDPQPGGDPTGPDDGGQGYDLSRLPRAAREEIQRLRQLTRERETQLRAAQVSQHAYGAAQAHGVNPQALLGSLAWQQAATQLDPAAPDYQQRLAWTVQQIAQANPWMAAQQGQQQPPPPARSGGDFGGAPGTPPPSLDEQIREAQQKGDWRTVIRLQNQKLAAAHQQQQ